VLLRELDESVLRFGFGGDPAYPDVPFLRWRHRLHAWHQAVARGWSDDAFIELVLHLDRAVAAVDGYGFRVTPLHAAPALAHALGLTGPLWVKDDTHNVAGSHKARHLFGILLALEIADRTPDGTRAATPSHARPLAIASCGNAALGAAVLARAAERRLLVFIPPDAAPPVVARLAALGADIVVCDRAPGELGDPCVTRFRSAVAAGALPFACQGPENGLAIEGGETLGWELVTQLDAEARRHGAPRALGRVFVQVGGGALGSAVGRAFQQALAARAIAQLPRLHAVQTTGAWPLARAYERLARHLDTLLRDDRSHAPGEPSELDLSPEALAFRTRRADRIAHAFASDPRIQAELTRAAHDRASLMWPWETPPTSVAHGILDDETYDWLALTRAMLQSGGFPIVVDEPTLLRANALATAHTATDADETGTAGLAGLLALAASGTLDPREATAVFFTGARRRASTVG
jgi:threonine dehydratase